MLQATVGIRTTDDRFKREMQRARHEDSEEGFITWNQEEIHERENTGNTPKEGQILAVLEVMELEG